MTCGAVYSGPEPGSQGGFAGFFVTFAIAPADMSNRVPTGRIGTAGRERKRPCAVWSSVSFTQPQPGEQRMLKGIGIVTLVIFLIGLAVVIGLLKLIF